MLELGSGESPHLARRGAHLEGGRLLERQLGFARHLVRGGGGGRRKGVGVAVEVGVGVGVGLGYTLGLWLPCPRRRAKG